MRISGLLTIHDYECKTLERCAPSKPIPNVLIGVGVGSRCVQHLISLSEGRDLSGPWVVDRVDIEGGMRDAGGRLIPVLIQEWASRRIDSSWKLSMSGKPIVKIGDWIDLDVETEPIYRLQVQRVKYDESDTTYVDLGRKPPSYQTAFNAMSDLQGAYKDEYLTTDTPQPTCTAAETAPVIDSTLPLANYTVWAAYIQAQSGCTIANNVCTVGSGAWFACHFVGADNSNSGKYIKTIITATITGTASAAKVLYQPDGGGDWILASTLTTGTHTITIPVVGSRDCNVIVWSDSNAGNASIAITSMQFYHATPEVNYLIIGDNNNPAGTPYTFKFTPGNPGSYNSPRILLDLSFEYYMSLNLDIVLTVNGHSGTSIPELMSKAWCARDSITDWDITQWAVYTENTVTVSARYYGTFPTQQTIKVSPSAKIVRRTPLS